MLAFAAAQLMPWRSHYQVHASDNGLTFVVHRRDAIGRHIAKYGAHEPDLTAWIARHLERSPPGIFVDVGANIGWHSVHAARHSVVETVVAFEPDDINASLLEQNLSINGVDKAVVCRCAVGAEPGAAHLHRYKDSNRGRHSLLANHGLGAELVPVRDLDGALDDLGLGDHRIVVLKIDVEGYEPAVIDGAKRTLARTDAVVLEFSPSLSRDGGLSTSDMARRLQHCGFKSFALGIDGSLEAIDRKYLDVFEGQMDVVWAR